MPHNGIDLYQPAGKQKSTYPRTDFSVRETCRACFLANKLAINEIRVASSLFLITKLRLTFRVDVCTLNLIYYSFEFFFFFFFFE